MNQGESRCHPMIITRYNKVFLPKPISFISLITSFHCLIGDELSPNGTGLSLYFIRLKYAILPDSQPKYLSPSNFDMLNQLTPWPVTHPIFLERVRGSCTQYLLFLYSDIAFLFYKITHLQKGYRNAKFSYHSNYSN